MASEASIRTLIVDDEAPARSRLRQLLKDQSDFQIVAECANGRQAVDAIQRQKPDLVFLDVQMPGLTGLQVCDTVLNAGAPLPCIIFVTAYDEYALKAFEIHALDYLLKPFDRERFLAALRHARHQMARSPAGQPDQKLTALLEQLRAGSRASDRLVYKQNGRVVFVRTDTVDWIEADGNYVRLHTGPESHHFRETLAGIEDQLPRDQFMRISRSVIVNLDRIKELQPLFYGDYVVVLRDGSRLNMSRNYRDRIEALIDRRA